MDPQQLQLQCIAEITTLLLAAHIPHWLFGGWAIDFLVGARTRSHDDVEFIVWTQDASAVQALLTQHGYRETTVSEEKAVFFKAGQRVEVMFIERNAAGQIVTPGAWANWPWPEEAFAGAPARLGSVTCPVTSAASLLETKEGYAQHPAGGPLRDKDRADIQRLRAFLQAEE